MSWDALSLAVLRWIVQASELSRRFWYLVIPGLAALALVMVLRARYWPADATRRRWHGLLVDVSEQHDLIVLIHAARQDAAFRAEVLRLLALPAEARLALLEETLADMQAQGAPPSFVEAIGLLRDEHVVEQTRRLLDTLD